METICRLCCSTKFVNNYIFDEENALFLQMSYLPIKVRSDDRLPKRICDKCSCKVNDFYQFCNEAIEVQARLRTLLIASGIPLSDLETYPVKQPSPSPPPTTFNVNLYHDQGTQTEQDKPIDLRETITVKKEEIVEPSNPPSPPVAVKTENDLSDIESVGATNGTFSDDSEDLSLLNLKEIKSNENGYGNNDNGEFQTNKTTKKRKGKLKVEILIDSIPEPAITMFTTKEKKINLKTKEEKVKKEVDDDTTEDDLDNKNKKRKKDKPRDMYRCCNCSEKFTGKREIIRHYKSHASPVLDRNAPIAAPPEPAAYPFKCPRCQKMLQAGEWPTHWRRHWERDRQPFRCRLCEKTFRGSYQLFRHGLSHESDVVELADKRFVCDLCPESFVYMRCMLSHRALVHPEAAVRTAALRCRLCARQFAHTNSLRRHLRSHTGERNFLCNVCGKALSSAEHLKYHIRIHTGDKPNVCNTCGKGFAKKCNLTLHERVHSGEKPHVCSHCGKAFSQRSTLIIHERYHSGARPYVCDVCGRGFVSRGLLTMHVKSRCYAPE
ncbi:zinc finger protein 286A-like [Battus philenor]|uniref:zinc finger protein 286A-like n=1 Tax=Battus philenor TaxID=42288 RepID=UPI0035D0ED88